MSLIPGSERQRGRRRELHRALLSVPVVRHRLVGHVLQPGAGGSARQRGRRGHQARHHQTQGQR